MPKYTLVTKHIKLINSGKHLRVLSIVSLFLIIFGLPILLVEVNTQQILAPHASSTTGTLPLGHACTPKVGPSDCSLSNGTQMTCRNSHPEDASTYHHCVVYDREEGAQCGPVLQTGLDIFHYCANSVTCTPEGYCGTNPTDTPTPTDTPEATDTPTPPECGQTQGQHCNAVWTDKDSYTIEEQTNICYSVAAAGNITLTRTDNNNKTTTLASVHDDGTGACKNYPNTVVGTYTVTLNAGGEAPSTTYNVTDTCSTQGDNYTCMDTSCSDGYSQSSSGVCSQGSVCCVANQDQPTNTPEPTATDTPGPTATDTPASQATDTPASDATDTPAAATDTPGGATDTPNPAATDTPTPTGQANGQSIFASLSVKLQAIDIGAKTGKGYKINNAPQNPTRPVTLDIYKATDDPTKVGPLSTIFDTLTFDAKTGDFTNNKLDLSLGQAGSFPSGSYKIYVKEDTHLRKLLGTISISTADRTINDLNNGKTPVLLAGDINNDNNVDILDYNELVSCFPNNGSANTICNLTAADINDNGNPNDNDWNDDLAILLENFGKSGD